MKARDFFGELVPIVLGGTIISFRVQNKVS